MLLNKNDNRNTSEIDIKITNNFVFCHHIGILLFITYLTKICKEVPFSLQWFVTVLIGAVNIEQTKLLDFESINLIFRNFIKNLTLQRIQLSEIGTKENLKKLLQFNAQIIGIENDTKFYYDPHTKRYTGMYKILKGWCGNLGKIAKILNIDFFHTTKGYPLYLEHDDNYYDMRERFLKQVERLRETLNIPEEKNLTFIIDRGIYKMELFNNLIGTKNHIITWEKDYEKGQWRESNMTGNFTITKYRNSSKDLLTYNIKYTEQEWSKNSKIRQLIVYATNPKNVSIELSILVTNPAIPAKDCITDMLNRWIQENDNKYLITHFGIDYITSYDIFTYKEIKHILIEKNIKSGELKSLQNEKKNIEKELSKYLISENQNKKSNKKIQQKINFLSNELKRIKSEIKNVYKTQSKIDYLIKQETIKLDTCKKITMDTIKIIARNIFYLSIKQFIKMYDNFRDDHVIFRNLSQSHGCIMLDKENVRVLLYPTIRYSPKIKQIIKEFLDIINSQNNVLPDNSNRKITISLLEENSIVFAIQNQLKLPF